MALTTSAHEIMRASREAGGEDVPDQVWALVDRYRGELINQAYSILGNLQDAEEVVQDSFCELYQKPKQLTEARSLGGLLRSINRANALDRLRSRRRDSQRLKRQQEAKMSPERTTGGFSQLDAREAISKAIEDLPERMRAIVNLRYWDHLPYEAIGQRLDLPTSTVWQLFYDASERLFEKLQDQLPLDTMQPAAGKPCKERST